MHYIVTGCDGKLGGRTAKLMLQQVAPADLTFTCPFLDRLDPEKKARWESLGVKVCQANYDDPDEMVKAFAGGDRIFIVSAVTIGEIRVRQHKNVVDAALAAGVKHITYTSFLGASALTEDMVAAIGLLLLFVIVAAGVAILLPSGIRLERYEFLEKEPIATEYGVAGIVEAKREAFAPTYHTGLVVGIVLCILSVVPLFFCMALEAELACVFAVCLILVLIAVGVYIIIRVACPWEAYEKLLEEGNYTREHKAENRRNDPFTGFYWCLTTAIYLAVSFYTGQWTRTWIIWSVAALLFAALLALRRMLRQPR